MENIKTQTYTEFENAISAIRKGDIDNGLQLLDTADCQPIIKNLAKAEIAYWREDWKNAMYFDEHSLSSDSQWMDPFVVPHHLRAYVLAAQKTGSISRAKEFLDYYIAQKRGEYDLVGIRPFNKIYKNAMRRLDNMETKDNPPDIKIITKDNADCEFKLFIKNEEEIPPSECAPGVGVILHFMWNNAATDSVLELYETYAEYIAISDHHLIAARNYLALNDKEQAEKCLMRYVKTWNPTEKFQVMPMKLFVYKDIMDFMDKDIKERILKTPKSDK